MGSVDAVRSSAGDTYFWSGSLLYLRVVQPPQHYTGSPDWEVVPDAQLGAGASPFERNGLRVFRYSWHTYTLIEAQCEASTLDAGAPPTLNRPPPQ